MRFTVRCGAAPERCLNDISPYKCDAAPQNNAVYRGAPHSDAAAHHPSPPRLAVDKSCALRCGAARRLNASCDMVQLFILRMPLRPHSGAAPHRKPHHVASLLGYLFTGAETVTIAESGEKLTNRNAPRRCRTKEFIIIIISPVQSTAGHSPLQFLAISLDPRLLASSTGQPSCANRHSTWPEGVLYYVYRAAVSTLELVYPSGCRFYS
jgi:hypothetical protein